MAHIACDIDGTITSAPYQFENLLTALRAAGHRVTILTGCATVPVTQQNFDEKAQFLMGLGCVGCWDDMVVFGESDKALAKAKAKWMADNGVSIFIDNDLRNAQRATKVVPLVLVPWTTRKS